MFLSSELHLKKCIQLHLLLDWKIEHETVSLLAMMEGDWADSVRDRILKEEGM